jgi:hypothetical protein
MAKELGGEKELFQVLKNAEKQLMEKLSELLKRTGHKSLESLMLDYGFDKNSEEGQFKLLQELAARWAETLINKPKPSWWKELLKSIGNWIKQFTSKILNEQEVDELVGGFVKYGTIDRKEFNNNQDIKYQLSKEQSDAIDNVFDENPELSKIGTVEQYSQYLDNIGVTQIAYHHSNENIEQFKTFAEGYFPQALKKKGTHYKEADDVVFFVKKPLTEEFMSKRKFKGVWGLKINNVLQFNAGEKIGEGVHPGIDEGVKKAIDNNYDAVDFGRIRDNKTWSEVIAITNPNKAVKLGSKQDIEGFKDFVNNKQFQKLTAEEKAKTIEQITKEHRSITALKDLAHKLAYRIGGKVEFVNKTDAD